MGDRVGDRVGDMLGRMTRREAVARVAQLLGGALAAPTVAGVLAGCGASPDSATTGWKPRTLSREQSEVVLIMGEIILPETDTPGARAARVDRFIDAMLSDYYADADRRRFLAGLERVEARARSAFGARFGALPAERQLELVRALNRQAFLPTVGEAWHPEDTGPGSFFRTLKELVVVGYYTSEMGATKELRVNPMGSWRADIPYDGVGGAWS